ncbi:unnamed protein product, partial [Dovyalis caffra]
CKRQIPSGSASTRLREADVGTRLKSGTPSANVLNSSKDTSLPSTSTLKVADVGPSLPVSDPP